MDLASLPIISTLRSDSRRSQRARAHRAVSGAMEGGPWHAPVSLYRWVRQSADEELIEVPRWVGLK